MRLGDHQISIDGGLQSATFQERLKLVKWRASVPPECDWRTLCHLQATSPSELKSQTLKPFRHSYTDVSIPFVAKSDVGAVPACWNSMCSARLIQAVFTNCYLR